MTAAAFLGRRSGRPCSGAFDDSRQRCGRELGRILLHVTDRFHRHTDRLQRRQQNGAHVGHAGTKPLPGGGGLDVRAARDGSAGASRQHERVIVLLVPRRILLDTAARAGRWHRKLTFDAAQAIEVRLQTQTVGGTHARRQLAGAGHGAIEQAAVGGDDGIEVLRPTGDGTPGYPPASRPASVT